MWQVNKNMSANEQELLEEIVKWLRFMGMQDARDIVERALRYEDAEKEHDAKVAYQLTDGENSTYDIADHISYSYQWVSTRQQEWAKLGIVEKEGPNSPYEHIMSLDKLGIDAPDIPDPEEDDDEEADEEDAEQATLEEE
jgi:hypothetical protein